MAKYKYKVWVIPTAGITAAIVEAALNIQGALGWEVIYMQVVGTNLMVVAKKIVVA